MLQPTLELQAKLRCVRLVIMDIDGTLITSPRDVFGNVANQLRRLRRFNVRFSLATGRTIAGSRSVIERLRQEVGMRMPPVINYNGAVMLSSEGQSLVVRHVLEASLVADAVAACRQLGLWPLVYGCRDIVSGPPTETVYLDQAAPFSGEFNGMAIERVVDVGRVDDDVVAVLADAGDLSASVRVAKMLSERFGERLRATTSGSRYVEICASQASKLSAMRRLAALHHIDVHHVMAIGDNLNDLEMIACAGVGIAVGNAPDEVKAAADYACSHSSASGVVEALRMLVQVLRVQDGTTRGSGCTETLITSDNASTHFLATAS